MSAADFFIPSLPGQPADATVTMYGGHIASAPPKNGSPDTESDAHLYFYLVRNRHIADTERTLLWSVPAGSSDSARVAFARIMTRYAPLCWIPSLETDRIGVRSRRFNGGPGCSSFDGGLMEIGPFRLAPHGDGKLVELEGAWNEYANVIFSALPLLGFRRNVRFGSAPGRSS